MALVQVKADLLKVFEEKFRSLEAGLNGSATSTVHQKRKEAFKNLLEKGFPDRKSEEYKYTPLTQILEKEWTNGVQQIETESDFEKQDIRELFANNKDINLLVFENGKYSPAESRITEEANITLIPWSGANKLSNEIFDMYFNENTKVSNDSFALLNTSLSSEGVFLHVPKNTLVNLPIVIIQISNNDQEENMANPRNLFVFEEGSQATIFECFQTGGNQPVFTNSLSEFFVKSNANIRYRRVGIDGQNSIRVTTNNVYQENDSQFSSTVIDFGGKMVRNNLNVISDGSGCSTDLYGLYLLNGASHVDNHTMVDHKKPNSGSNEHYKGILGGKSRGVFNGKIYVRRDAQKTNAFQQNGNILLSDEADINTKPQLEIWADDVKCSHGCTTGQIDNEQIFYLRARGIDEKSAKKMLLKAYAKDILSNIELNELQIFTEEYMHKMLTDM